MTSGIDAPLGLKEIMNRRVSEGNINFLKVSASRCAEAVAFYSTIFFESGENILFGKEKGDICNYDRANLLSRSNCCNIIRMKVWRDRAFIFCQMLVRLSTGMSQGILLRKNGDKFSNGRFASKVNVNKIFIVVFDEVFA